ncbi:MAG: radical SAM protein [Pseudodesulfovibrio sp.]
MPNEGLEFPSSAEEVMRIFNSESYKNLRRRLLDGDVKGTGCEVCLKRRGQRLAEIDAGSGKPLAVIEKARASIERGDTEVDYNPFTLSLNSSTECNLRCIMCYNSNLPEQRMKNSLVPYKKFISAIEDIGFENIKSISVVGGEPFMTEDALETFKHIANDPNGGVYVSANTNGTLLHNHWDLIKKFTKLKLEFSIDAFEENYEKIRKRASWDRMIKNFLTYSEIVSERPDFDIGINVVVMKSSLPDMHKLVKLAAEHNAKIRFSSIAGDYFEENIFQFPELLDGIPWQEYFDTAVAEANRLNPDAAAMLRGIRADLEMRIAQSDKHMVDGGCLEVITHQKDFLKSLPQKKIALLGMSSEVLGLLGSIDGDVDKELMVVDFDFQDVGRSYLGHRIILPEQVPDEVEIGVISSNSFKYTKYKEWFSERFPDFSVTSLPHWSKASYEMAETVSLELKGKPVILFATGGTADILLDTTGLGDVNYVACSDNNEDKWGTTYKGLPIVPPSDIQQYAKDVLVCSDFYSKAIKESLEKIHGDEVNVHIIF